MNTPKCKRGEFHDNGSPCIPSQLGSIDQQGKFDPHDRLWWCECGRVFYWNEREYKVIIDSDPDDPYVGDYLVEDPQWESDGN